MIVLVGIHGGVVETILSVVSAIFFTRTAQQENGRSYLPGLVSRPSRVISCRCGDGMIDDVVCLAISSLASTICKEYRRCM
jgi:hypothetical protein